MSGPLTRRRYLVAGLGSVAGAIAGCQSPGQASDPGTTSRSHTESTDSPETSTTTSTQLPERIGAETVVTGMTAPLDVAFEPLPGIEAYIADQAGQIHVLTADGRRPDPLLDVTDRMVDLGGYEERGLLGIALHPDFASNRRLFVRYSGSDRPSGFSHTFVLAEFEVSDDGTAVESGSERRLLEIPEPQSNHNGGPIVFGPEKFLYVGVGDGGGGDDRGQGHVEDWYDRNVGGNGQDVTQNLLGSILRIDVDTETGDRAYGIPSDNPLVGGEGLDEHYAWGFRNPWGMTFTGEELFVADVGQNRFEEIDLVRKGGNYGWNVKEGTHCFSTDSPSDPPETCPSETPDGQALIEPIIEYSHGGTIGGVAAVGGYLYNGSALPGLADTYVFADWRSNGRLYVAPRTEGDGLWPISAIPVEGSQHFGSNVLGFGRDPDGELYVLTSRRSTVSGSTGAMHRLVSA